MGETDVFEALFVLTFFGVLYVDIIEILEKCAHPHQWAAQGVRPGSQDTPRR
jgi:hypothetical protein